MVNNKKKICKEFAYVALLLLPVLLLLWRVFVGFIPVAYKMDFLRFLTQQIRTIEDIKAGSFPLWNQYILCGMPSIANVMTNLFSPFLPLYLVLGDPVYTYVIVMILDLFILCVSFFYMMKTVFKVTNLSAYTAAIAFTFCGFFFWILNVSMRSIEDLLFIYPLAFIAYYKLRSTSNIKWGILMGLIMALTCLNCNGAILQYGYNLSFLVFFHIFCSIFLWKSMKNEIRINCIFLLGMFLSLSLCAFQLFPVYDAVQLSTRFTGVVSYTPQKIFPTIVSFIYPDIWPVFKIGAMDKIRSLQYGVVGYSGIPVIVLALIGAFYHRNKKRIFFAVYPMLYLIAWPIYANDFTQRLIPSFLKAGNHLFYSFYLYAFCIAVLAGLGMDYIKSNLKNIKACFLSRRVLSKIITCFILFLTVLYSISLTLILSGKFVLYKYSSQIKDLLVSKITKIESLQRSAEFYSNKVDFMLDKFVSKIPLFVFSNSVKVLSLVIILLLIYRTMKHKKILLYLFVGCALFDLLCVGYQHLEWHPRDYYHPETPEVVFIKNKAESELFRIGVFYEDSICFWEKYPDASFEEFSDYSYNISERLHENIIIHFGIQKVGAFTGLCPNRQHQYFGLLGENNRGFGSHGLFLTDFSSPLLDLINMKYVFSPKNFDLNLPKLKKVFTGNRYYIYENLNSMPRAFYVPNASYLDSFDSFSEKCLNNDVDFSKKVFISEIKPVKALLNNHSNATGRVEILSYSPNEVVLGVFAEESGWVVLSDAYHHGWHAHVDGVKTQIYPANHLMRAVYVDKGKHTVKFRYFSSKLYVGIIISGSSLLLCFGLLAFNRRRYTKE